MTYASNFAEHTDLFEGVPVRYWESDGLGEKPPLLLLHGSGPGVGTQGNWRLVLEPLSQSFHVIAGDLIGFGLSGRKQKEPFFDYDMWLRQCEYLLNRFEGDSVNVLGHSLSGSLALKLAARTTKICRVATTGTLGSPVQANPALDVVWTFPETEEDLISAGRTLVYDGALIDQAYIEGRKKILYDGTYKNYFQRMFAGNKQQFIDASVLTEAEVAAIRCPVLLIHGRDDRPISCESSRELATRIPHADYIQLAKCGHSVALEQPEKLIGLAKYFFL